MDFDAIPPSDGPEKLKCSSCSKCLSYFPIYISEDKETICGRCLTSPLPKSYINNEAFEALAQHVDFPCCYKNEGCFHKAPPKDIPNHELVCLYRIVQCPTSEFTNCVWTGAKPTVLNHCQDQHFDLFFKDGQFQFDLTHECLAENNNLLEHDSVLFIVSQKFNPHCSLLDFSIFHTECDGNLDQFSCEVNFSTDNRNISVKCSITSFNDRKITEIFLNSLKDSKTLNESVVVSAKISLQKSDIFNSSVIKAKINEELLANLVCSMCKCFTLPPIYQYTKDNALENGIWCSKCIELRGADALPGLRNFSLDNIANFLNYPCENKLKGCNFVGKPGEMTKHMSFCPQKNFSCPVNEFVKCFWIGLYKDLYIHMQSNHSDMLIERFTEITENIEKKVPDAPSSSVKKPQLSSTSNSNTLQFGVAKSNNPTPEPSPFQLVATLESQVASTQKPTSVFRSSSSTSNSNTVKFGVATSNKTTPQLSTQKPQLFSGGANSASQLILLKPISVFEPSSTPTFGAPSFISVSKSTSGSNAFSFATPPAAPSTFDFSIPISLTTPDSNKNGVKCYIMKFSNRLFRVNYVQIDVRFYWCIQAVGPFHEQFMYELKIFDKNDNRNSLIIRQLCSPLIQKDRVHISPSCCFHKRQLSGFISNDEITFKVNVFK